VHTGGEDHIYTHHPNEIAQSEGATGKTFVRYWVHGRFLRWDEDSRRMSKSSGEFLVVDDLVKRGFDPLAFRYSCLMASYRVPLAFSWAGLQQADEGLRRLCDNVRRLAEETDGAPSGRVPVDLDDQFRSRIGDDLDMPGALAVTSEAIHSANRASDAREKRGFLALVLDHDRVLGLGLADAAGTARRLPDDVAELIRAREGARRERDWATADVLRDKLRERGSELEDTPQGTRWRLFSG
jgi:cysteinyl-tRNA synthetase